jgi:hypothetical protein
VGVSDGRSEDWVAGFNHAMRVLALWLEFQQSLPNDGSCAPPGLNRVGMRKSNLLGRLVRREEIRRRPCPVHKGRLISAPWDRDGLTCGCDGTGWLPNEPEEPARKDSHRRR